MVYLIDIINFEYGIGQKILNNNNFKITKILSKVCKKFNKIVKDDMDKYYNKYIKNIILQKFDVIIKNKMYASIKNNYKNNSIYKSLEDYDEELHKLSKQINNKIYNDVINDLTCIYKEYIFEEKISNSCYEIYLYGIMIKEYLKLLKYLENKN